MLVRHAPRFALIVVSSAVTAVLAAASPLPLRLLIDSAIGGKPVGGATSTVLEALGLPTTGHGLAVVTAIAFAALAGLLAGSVALTGHLWAVVGNRLVEELTCEMFQSSMSASDRFHRQVRPADQMVRLVTDSWAVYTVASLLIGLPSTRLLTAVAVAVAAWQLDPALSLWVFALAPTLAVVARMVGRRLTRESRGEADSRSELSSVVRETVRGLADVHHLNAGDHQQAMFAERARQWRFQSVRSVTLQASAAGVTAVLTHLVRAVILVAGGLQVLAGTTTIGTLVAFLSYAAILAAQGEAAAAVHRKWRSSKAGLDRVHEVLSAEPRAARVAGQALVSAEAGLRVEFQSVGYAYDDRPVLHDISLTAEPGTVTALVGPTGAGKSTLMSLLPRLIEPDTGTITLNGADYREIPLDVLRNLIAVVRQEPYLFPAPIYDNIAYGRPDATADQIHAAAQAANAHDFIQALPAGYQTIIGDGGAGLSGGQSQRLAIARALLKDAPILILDEPTSALDAGTEADVLDAIDRLVQGRTVFVIAHRFSTIRSADTIAVLDHGRIVEHGTHDQLLAANGLYTTLHTIQSRAAAARRAGIPMAMAVHDISVASEGRSRSPS
jgi:ATP-binding cassette subfamily B protein/subfamily B ATP-binding cassette protein MsbA